MKLFGGILGRGSSDEAPEPVKSRVPQRILEDMEASPMRPMPNAQPQDHADIEGDNFEEDELDDVNLSTIEGVIDSIGKPRQSNDVNIWDIEEDDVVDSNPAKEAGMVSILSVKPNEDQAESDEEFMGMAIDEAMSG